MRIHTAVAAALALLLGAGVVTQQITPLNVAQTAEPLPSPDPCAQDAALRLVSGGDALVRGNENDDPKYQPDSDRYSEKLLEQLKQASGPQPSPWCLFNITDDDATTTDDFMTENDLTQQSKAHALRPRLITLTIGRQNAVIVKHVTDCFKNIKDHDFLEANTCALEVLGNDDAWTQLRNDLAEILNRFMIQMDGSPRLVVAVTGYFNPYNSATSVATEIPGFCAKLIDTIPTCTIRWVQLPPALVTLDQVVKKLNETIKGVVDEFTQTSQGRFFFINPYKQFKDHCMKMEVEIKTRVFHPPNQVHNHDSKNDFGCDEPWVISDGHDGTKSPFIYLTPAATGVLISATQKTVGMGIYPNAKGHQCLADLIYQAVKNKLGIPEQPEEPCRDV